jgi:hypothetical protein
VVAAEAVTGLNYKQEGEATATATATGGEHVRYGAQPILAARQLGITRRKL